MPSQDESQPQVIHWRSLLKQRQGGQRFQDYTQRQLSIKNVLCQNTDQNHTKEISSNVAIGFDGNLALTI